MAWYYTFEAKEIQSFILQSDKLRDMVGGSELVSRLCGTFLDDALRAVGVAEPRSAIIATAAGWARICFDDQSQATAFSCYWPMLVSRYAPGLRLIQASLEIRNTLPDAIRQGIDLLRAERNLFWTGLPEIGPLVERNPRTGLAACDAPLDRKAKKAVPRDRQTRRKQEYSKNHTSLTGRILPALDHDAWPYELEDIASDASAYVAVIHADGNDLGSSLMRIGEHLKANPEKAAGIYRDLSQAIDRITVNAVREATETVLLPDYQERKKQYDDAKIAARPIVLGGDDLTIIVRADLAVAFATTFLNAFERQAQEVLTGLRATVHEFPETLTACAGVAVVKKAYPFAAAYHMADTLCDYTKRQAKADREARRQKGRHLPVPSSFTVHRITGSMAEGYAEVQRQELTGRGQYEGRPIRFWYGPYAVGGHAGNLPLHSALQRLTEAIRSLPGGAIRTLISTLHTDPVTAHKDYERVLEVAVKDSGAAFSQALQQLTASSTTPLWNHDGQTPLADAYLLRELEKGAAHA